MGGDRVAGILLAALAITGIYLYDSPNRDRLAAAWTVLTSWKPGAALTITGGPVAAQAAAPAHPAPGLPPVLPSR